MGDTITHAAWDERYRIQHTPWDMGGPHPLLVQKLESGALSGPGRTLSPGCGRAHDAQCLAEHGFTVTAVDVAASLLPELGPRLEALGGRFLVEDALAHRDEDGYDLIFEHTFLCALDPTQRPDWAEMVRSNLRPQGRLVVLVFPLDKDESQGGPPHGLTVPLVAELLGPDFTLEQDELHGKFGRAYPHRYAVFSRR